MEITKQNIAKVLGVLRTNLKLGKRATHHSELVKKTGLSSAKVATVRKEMLREGVIREQRGSTGRIEVFLAERDNLHQVLAFVVEHQSASASEIAERLKVPEPEVQQICLELIRREMFEVTSISVKRGAILESILS